VNPGTFDTTLLDTLEAHRLYPRYVLVTTAEPQHTRGLETLKRVYDATVFAAAPIPGAAKVERVSDGQVLRLEGMDVSVIGLSAYRIDAVAFSWRRFLFPGNVLQAGTIVIGDDTHATIDLRTVVRERLLSLSGDTLILPSIGPPTTVETEQRRNIDVADPRYR
jgi:glyoxylase-like metal-dependent hydrolase (beta-lactamase superfamily II)